MPNLFYTTVQLGPKRHTTHEGFLVCEDVPLARIGEQLYGPGETPIDPAPGSQAVRIMREPEEVFRPETIRSANGKPIVIHHPPTMEVTPKTWRDLARGHIQNPRRGTGADADLLLGDLVFQDEDAIALVDAGMREVSMGYVADYDEVDGPKSGRGAQRNILFNHVALVPEGRCGPRCSIGDHSQCDNPEGPMATKVNDSKPSVLDRVRAAFHVKDEKALNEALGDLHEGGEADGAVVIHNHMGAAPAGDAAPALDGAPAWFKEFAKATDTKFATLTADIKKVRDAKAKDEDDEETEEEKKKRLAAERAAAGDANDDDDDDEEEKKRKARERAAEGDEAILGEFKMEAPPGTGDSITRKTADSVLFEDSFQRTVADAEILAPGIAVPVYDSRAKPRITFDAICGLRRRALGFTIREAAGDAMVKQVTGGRDIDPTKMSCGDVRSVFNATVALRKAQNNRDNTDGANRIGDARSRTSGDKAIPRNQADINRMNREMWETKKAS